MPTITPCLWFDGKAQEAAEFYASVFPDSRVGKVDRSAAETPSGPKGMELTVEFTLSGQPSSAPTAGPTSSSTRRSPSWSTARTRPRSTTTGRR